MRHDGQVRKFYKTLRASPLLKSGMGALIIQASYLPLSLLITISLARVLGPEPFGAYSMAFSLLLLVGLPVQLGLSEFMVREVASDTARTGGKMVGKLIQYSNRVVLAYSLALITILLGYISLVGNMSNRMPSASLAMAALAALALSALVSIRGGVLRGLNRVVRGQIPPNILQPIAFLVIFYTYASFYISRSPTATEAMYCYAGAAMVTLILGQCWVNEYRPKVADSQEETPPYNKWLRYLALFGLLYGTSAINQNSMSILTGLFEDTRNVGYFRIAVQFANVMPFVMAALNIAIQPTIARYYIEGDIRRLQNLVLTHSALVIVGTWTTVLLLVSFSATIIETLFGLEYLPAVLPLAIMGLAKMFDSACGATGLILTMTGRLRDHTKTLFAGTLTTVIAGFALIPLYGIAGAAFATLLGSIICNIWQIVVIRRKLGFSSSVFVWLFVGGPTRIANSIEPR